LTLHKVGGGVHLSTLAHLVRLVSNALVRLAIDTALALVHAIGVTSHLVSLVGAATLVRIVLLSTAALILLANLTHLVRLLGVTALVLILLAITTLVSKVFGWLVALVALPLAIVFASLWTALVHVLLVSKSGLIVLALVLSIVLEARTRFDGREQLVDDALHALVALHGSFGKAVQGRKGLQRSQLTSLTKGAITKSWTLLDIAALAAALCTLLTAVASKLWKLLAITSLVIATPLSIASYLTTVASLSVAFKRRKLLALASLASVGSLVTITSLIAVALTTTLGALTLLAIATSLNVATTAETKRPGTFGTIVVRVGHL
jgi:hypothetical protein